jgi:hypothetical protein
MFLQKVPLFFEQEKEPLLTQLSYGMDAEKYRTLRLGSGNFPPDQLFLLMASPTLDFNFSLSGC